MTLYPHIQEGLRNLYYSKLRSILALLGILVGTASVVAMVLGGELATQEALRQFKSLGTDLFAMSINQSYEEKPIVANKTESLTLTEAVNLYAQNKNILNAAPYTQLFFPVSYEGHMINAISMGVTDAFFNILHVAIAQGRKISIADQFNFYCVIGEAVYKELKQINFASPIGKNIQIGKQIFKIVGIAKTWPENSFVYADINHSILLPIQASLVMSKNSMINNIVMKLASETDIELLQFHLEKSLKKIAPDKQASFRSAKEIIAKMQKQNDILTIFLGLIGSISLLVGGIGVMNIMLVSVVERRREIGIRLAVGAKPWDIQILFLIEAIMLSLIGGTIGVLLGMIIAYIIAIFSNWEFTLFWWPPIAGFCVSVAVGIFFGFYPAYLASKLNPIEALRAE